MRTEFSKRVSSPRLFFQDLWFVLAHIPAYVAVFSAKRVSLAFAEKIRLVTTAVNQCVLCARVHAEWALRAGVDRDEIRALLDNDLDGRASADDVEVTALLYAQHYAESNRNPVPEMTRRLYEHYGDDTATHIMLIIRLINFLNLAGNTLEALVSRVRGIKVRQGNVVFEVLLGLVGAPIVLPLLVYTQATRTRFASAAGPTDQGREATD